MLLMKVVGITPRGLRVSIRKSSDVTIVDLRGRSLSTGESELLSNRLRELIAKGGFFLSLRNYVFHSNRASGDDLSSQPAAMDQSGQDTLFALDLRGRRRVRRGAFHGGARLRSETPGPQDDLAALLV